MTSTFFGQHPWIANFFIYFLSGSSAKMAKNAQWVRHVSHCRLVPFKLIPRKFILTCKRHLKDCFKSFFQVSNLYFISCWWLMKVWKLGKKQAHFSACCKGVAEPVVAGFLLVTSGAKSSELDSNRGSECFGCLVSTEAHGDDGCQVLLREALCGRGPRARATAWQHQRGSEICSQSHRGEHEEWAKHTDRGFSFWQTSRCSTHRGLPYGSWSNSWQHRFQCCQCSTPLFCTPPAGIPFHTTGTQWSHQGLELRVRWEGKKGLYEKCISMC